MHSGIDYASRKCLFGTLSHSPLRQFGNFSSPPVSEEELSLLLSRTTPQLGLDTIPLYLLQDSILERIFSPSCLEKGETPPINLVHSYMSSPFSNAKGKKASFLDMAANPTFSFCLFFLNHLLPFKLLQASFCPFHSEIIFLVHKSSTNLNQALD